ncbi:hypothetical protein BJV78DRAFT_1123383, partial [Lactifluus subvellereus]
YGSQTVRGVNLGGWFVLEVRRYSFPYLESQYEQSEIVDEWTFGQYQDTVVALATLTEHWVTWITKDDFRGIAAAG